MRMMVNLPIEFSSVGSNILTHTFINSVRGLLEANAKTGLI